MTDGIGGRFDQADITNIQDMAGGSLRSDAARSLAKARILMDGKVEDSEIEAYENSFYDGLPANVDMAAFDPVSGVSFEAAEANVDADVSYLKEFQTLPGSHVTGRPPHFADPMAMLAHIGQVDGLPETTNDKDRCGAGAWVAELVLRGPEALQKGADDLLASPDVPKAVKEQLKAFRFDQGPITPRALHLMMEAQYHGLRHAGEEAGIDSRRMEDHVAAHGGRRGHTEETLHPPARGERMMVMLRAGGGATDRDAHYVVIGHDRKGFYAVDPGMNTTHRFKSEKQLKTYMAQRTLALDDFGKPGKHGFYVMPLSSGTR
jgi:hypothetical protein